MTSSRVDYDPRLECGDNGDKYEYLCPQWDLARGQHIGRREAANLAGGKCQESACVAIRIDKFYFVSQRRLRIDFDNRAQISCQNAVIWKVHSSNHCFEDLDRIIHVRLPSV